MSLIVKVAGIYSDSYATLAEANARAEEFSGIYDISYWRASSPTVQEEYLRLAASVIDSLPIRGVKVNRHIAAIYSNGEVVDRGYSAQALAFPRNLQINRREIPLEVKNVQIDIAILSIAPLYPPIRDGTEEITAPRLSEMGVTSFKVAFEKEPLRRGCVFTLGDLKITVSSMVFLKLRPWLSNMRWRHIDNFDTYKALALAERLTTTTSSTSTTTSTCTTTTV